MTESLLESPGYSPAGPEQWPEVGKDALYRQHCPEKPGDYPSLPPALPRETLLMQPQHRDNALIAENDFHKTSNSLVPDAQ